jgi:D-alanyl-D-alanine carboxypeptidase
LKELADLAYTYPNQFKPGEGYQYTNTDYILLGLIIEKTSHHSIKYVLHHFFLNYNLTNTYYAAREYPEEVSQRLARGYDDEGTFAYNKDITDYSLSFASSAGAMISSPSDIIKFLLQLFSGKIVSKSTLDRMKNLISSDGNLIFQIQIYLF